MRRNEMRPKTMGLLGGRLKIGEEMEDKISFNIVASQTPPLYFNYCIHVLYTLTLSL